MGGACGRHGEEEKCLQGGGGEDRLEGLGVDERVMCKRILKE
jgi:hypothetical protein